VQHSFVDGVRSFIGEDTSGEEGDKFFDVGDAAQFHDVVADKNVLAIEFDLVGWEGVSLSCKV